MITWSLLYDKIYILPAYKKHQHRAVQIVYAATKQQLLRFNNIR